MTQAQLAAAAGVTRQTVSNLERGSVPQASILRKVLDVLGVTPGGSAFSRDTDMWLGLIGGVLEQLPDVHRARAGEAAFHAATAELVAMSAAGSSVEPADFIEVGEVEKGAKSAYGKAASRGTLRADEQPHAE